MAIIKTPCLDCEDRHTLCHSECDKYLSYRRKLDEINEQLLNESRADGVNIDSARRAVKRSRR